MKQLSYLLLTAALFATSCKDDGTDNNNTNNTNDNTANTVPSPTIIPYTLVKEYPHDPTAFTQGLQFVDGVFYEGTGRYGKSDVRKVDPATGKVLQKTPMDAKYFGEGITVLKGKIYQITYMEHTGFVYDQKTLKQVGTFTYPNQEGWGLTSDGTNLIYNDGGHVLYFIDPNTFKEIKRVEVIDSRGPVKALNEMEYIKGFIYSNQWQTDFIYKIDPASGKVVGKADLFDLRQKANIPYPVGNNEDAPEVLNGIAYDATSNRIFVTGKNWPKLLEIKLDN